MSDRRRERRWASAVASCHPALSTRSSWVPSRVRRLALCLLLIGCSKAPPPPARPTPPSQAAPRVKAAPSSEAIDEALAASEKLLRAAEFEAAESIASKLAARAPNEWAAHELLGRVRAARSLHADAQGRAADGARSRDAALTAYQRAVELRPADAALRQSLAVLLQTAGRFDDAGAQFAEASRLDPGNAQYLLFEAQSLLLRERWDEARALIAQVLELRPDEPFAYATLAEIERQSGDHDAALESIRVARRLQPASLPLRVAEARLLRLAGRPREGLELLLAGGEAEWSDPMAIEETALGWSAVGEPARAAEAWDRCLLRNPSHPTARQRAAEAWRAAGDPVRASVIEREAAPSSR